MTFIRPKNSLSKKESTN